MGLIICKRSGLSTGFRINIVAMAIVLFKGILHKVTIQLHVCIISHWVNFASFILILHIKNRCCT